MEQKEKTHWKKNNDSNYISGEDLFEEINGFKKESVVRIKRFKDGDTYDRKSKETATKTILFLEDASSKELRKGVVLNKKAIDFFRAEFKSDFIDDWIGGWFTMFAQADKTHGHVVRFRKFYQPLDIEGGKNILNSSTNIDELGKNWSKLSNPQQANHEIKALKNQLKTSLNGK